MLYSNVNNNYMHQISLQTIMLIRTDHYYWLEFVQFLSQNKDPRLWKWGCHNKITRSQYVEKFHMEKLSHPLKATLLSMKNITICTGDKYLPLFRNHLFLLLSHHLRVCKENTSIFRRISWKLIPKETNLDLPFENPRYLIGCWLLSRKIS